MQYKREIWDNQIKNYKVIGKKNCPFCNINDGEEILIIYKTKYWEVRYNKYPYAGIKEHLLVFPNRHIILTSELNEKELLDLKNIHIFIKNFYKNKEYFSFIRETFGGRSIEHLHYHYLPGNIYSSDFNRILLKNTLGEK